MACACAVCIWALDSSASWARLDCSASALSALKEADKPLLGVTERGQTLLAERALVLEVGLRP